MLNARVLIVEDESIAALFLQKTLERMGFKVISVIKSGEEAIVAAGQCRPDIILMDIKLKDKTSGIEAAKIIYERHGIPSILMTAYSLEEFKSAYPSQSISEPIQKPIQIEELRDRIESILKLNGRN